MTLFVGREGEEEQATATADPCGMTNKGQTKRTNKKDK
jgi:hypothetical protein